MAHRTELRLSHSSGPRFLKSPWVWLPLVATLPFLPALTGILLWDDTAALTGNPVWLRHGPFNTLSALWSPWVRIPNEEHWWPGLYSLYWLETRLWPVDWAPGFHATNLLLHVACALAAWRFFRSMSLPFAAWGVALWAVHPVQAEAICWIHGRKDPLALLWVLACAASVRQSVRSGTWSRAWIWSLVAALCAACGSISKSTAVVAPVLAALSLIAAPVTSTRPRLRSAVLALTPATVVAVGLAIADVLGSTSAPLPLPPWSLVQRLALAGHSLVQYVRLLAVPLGLSAFYTKPDVSTLGSGWACVLAAVAVAIGLAAWVGRRRKSCMVGACAAAAFLVGLLPVLGFLRFGYMRYSYTADRYLYLPSLPLLAVVGSAASVWCARKASWRGQFCGALLITVLAVLSWSRALDYRSNVHLFAAATRKQPTSGPAKAQLGAELLAAGNYAQAEKELTTALELEPGWALALANLALLRSQQGKTTEAVDLYERALMADSRDSWPHTANELAWLLATSPDPKKRNAARALQLADRALGKTVDTGTPDSIRLRAALLDTRAAALAAQDRLPEAIQSARDASGLARAAARQSEVDGRAAETQRFARLADEIDKHVKELSDQPAKPASLRSH